MNSIIWFGRKSDRLLGTTVLMQNLTNNSWQTCRIWRNIENKLIYFCTHYWIFIFMLLKLLYNDICFKKLSSLSLDFQLYKGRINATSHVIQHPMYGAGHKFRTLHLPVSTTVSEVLDRVSGKSDLHIYFSLTMLYVYRNFIIFIILLHLLRNHLMTWNGQDGFTFQNMDAVYKMYNTFLLWVSFQGSMVS